MDTPSIADVDAALTAPGQMFEMEEVVIRGVPTRTWKHAPGSLRVLLELSRGMASSSSSSTTGRRKERPPPARSTG